MLPFDIILRGNFEKEDIIVETIPDKIFYPSELKEHIEKKWNEEKAKNSKKPFFAGPLCRLINIKLQNNKSLKLVLGDTDYKEYVGTRAPRILIEYGPRYVANPLAICSVVVTADQKILIARRSRKVELRPRYFHVPAGHIDPQKHTNCRGVPHPFAALIGELNEETGIIKTHIKGALCLGLVYDRVFSHPELVFKTDIILTSSELGHLNPSDKEMGRLKFIENNSKRLLNFITQHYREITPTGKANLILYGQHEYGDRWLRGLLAKIKISNKEDFETLSRGLYRVNNNLIKKYFAT